MYEKIEDREVSRSETCTDLIPQRRVPLRNDLRGPIGLIESSYLPFLMNCDFVGGGGRCTIKKVRIFVGAFSGLFLELQSSSMNQSVLNRNIKI